jgi:hypothetical protein
MSYSSSILSLHSVSQPTARVGPEAVRMLLVRRLVETPVCRRYVQIDLRDFMLSEPELAAKYGVPWHPPRQVGAVATSVVFAGLCLLVACIGKGVCAIEASRAA